MLLIRGTICFIYENGTSETLKGWDMTIKNISGSSKFTLYSTDSGASVGFFAYN